MSTEPTNKEETFHIRVDAELLEEISVAHENYQTLTCTKINKSEFCRTMFRLACKEIQRLCWEEQMSHAE